MITRESLDDLVKRIESSPVPEEYLGPSYTKMLLRSVWYYVCLAMGTVVRDWIFSQESNLDPAYEPEPEGLSPACIEVLNSIIHARIDESRVEYFEGAD